MVLGHDLKLHPGFPPSALECIVLFYCNINTLYDVTIRPSTTCMYVRPKHNANSLCFNIGQCLYSVFTTVDTRMAMIKKSKKGGAVEFWKADRAQCQFMKDSGIDI